MSGPWWSVVWSDPHERLFVERQHGSDCPRHRFRSNAPGDGSVVLARRADDRVLFIEIHRQAIDRTLLELPRGQADVEDGTPVVTAARELLEETGHAMGPAEVLGLVYPDSGLSGDAVHVVTTSGPELCETADAEFGRLRWLDAGEIDDAVRRGDIRDAITLAALALDRATGQSGSGAMVTGRPSGPITW